MSFRQFPAIGADGESYVIIEFRDELESRNGPQPRTQAHTAPRYELPDGRRLQRHGQRFITDGGELRLSTP
ncbi:hypothetical protein QSH46_013730 [Xanthomonas arboricola pv. juglandis]|uniref:Uncharacterized protein n=1 Tax=Xanthomonas campestris pv. juglandis TaxID=195709 RepID=A0A2N7V3P9_XANCJ|nr:hypothetical protein [Xanthomonas arboricola]AKU50294.1 hypothetical protein AKJ12_11280 [Xanthomonas arboricola pv. juglandis]KOB01133.1 hypothetical protein AE920_07220 [Xanthomonas arboricola]KOB03609.1 hypothetical protein AE921_02830 [Xanthomonas arboricola]KOB06991.1 hypothetical protein AE923_14645 [Xanthomonas arboricola]KOB09580.1 hypothetical protein AE922_06830 [Xanthomonas arboricola]